MKKCLLISFILCTNFTFAQISESFDDGDFTSGISWQGSTESFKVNESKQLQSLKANDAGSIYLSATNPAGAVLSWEFYIKLNFPPSSSNYARIYLMADGADLNTADGYFVQVGEDGSNDSFDLYFKQGRSVSRLINGKDAGAGGSSVQARIRVDRSANGKWALYSMQRGENQWTLEGSVMDTRAAGQASWFGPQFTYTKSRSDQFFFDDIRITASIPEPPPGQGEGEPGQPEDEPGEPGEDIEGQPIDPGDILISEVLFNPWPGGVDFVEIYNHSGKAFNLQALSLATLRNDSLSSTKPVSSNPRAFYPGEYLALSTDPAMIKSHYHTKAPNAFIKVPSLPGFNNALGTVILLASGKIIDQFSYSEQMHDEIIKDPEGVSLERVSFDRPANEPGNFRSAAAVVGYASPGYKNSQYTDGGETEAMVSLNSKTFSPDNDGFEDELIIKYRFPQAGSVSNVRIFDDKGVLVRLLSRNQSLARQGSISWNGLNEKGNLAAPGIYVVQFEIFDPQGSVKKYRKACVLAAKF